MNNGSSGIWRRVDLERNNVPEERVASIFTLETIRERRKALVVG
jgi:hypothetical protein